MITQYNPYATSGRKPVLFSRKQSANAVTAVFNGSGLPNRPMSNLLDNKVRKLEKSELHGLIALFKMKPRVWRDSQMWGAIAVEILAPTFPFAKNLKEAAKPNKKLIDVFSKTVTTKLGAALLCSVKLTHTGAEVSIPLTVVADDLLRLYAAASTLPEVATEFFQSGGRVVEAEATVDVSSLKFAYLDKALQNLFRVLGGTLSIRTVAGMNRLILTLQVTKTQVEYMCNADFDEVRGIDLYGLVRTWCLGRTDPAIGLPRTTRPLKGIVATLPPGGQPRTDADGILIDADSSVLYLPPETNNVGRYDDSLAMTLINDVDGSFSQYDGATVKKLPKAQNVLLDWVNLKWSYVNNSGNLEVRDLSRAQPLNVTHIRKVIYSPIVKVDAIINFITRMSQWAGMVGGTPFNDFKSFMANAVDLINLNQDYEGTRDAELALYHIAELAKMYTNPSTAWQARIQELQVYAHFVDNVRKIIAEIKKDEDKFFSMDTQSVLGVSMTMAFAIIFDKWAGQSDYVASQDTAKRAKYTNAHIDPNYKLPELPYMSVMGKVTPGMSKEQVDHAESLARGLMPHQANTTNLLRESPDNAILGVQAGGGKTMMIVVDILKEMQSGVKGPFLVLCPAHLVSQYVQEFTYATNGRVNVVAVTSYTLRRIGFTTLQKMIESAPINTVVVSDYNMAKGSSKTLKVGYGTASTQVYKVVEFLRQFNFQYAAMDESHKLKNQSATQTRAVAALVSDIPKKRLASGTFMDNSPSDIAGQFALLDPTVFGSVENFNARYSADGGPGKIRQMRPGANLEINRTLKENCCYVQVKRKEWAAVLPPRKEEMHFVDLTPAQRSMYDSILTSSIEELTAAAAKNDSLAKVLGIGKYANLSGQDKDELLDELDEEGQSSDLSGGLDELLRPYLARLEQFMVAPAADKLGKSLQGGDRISPKVAKLVEIFNKHVYEDETPGKILVFTNQTASALALYDMLPENIKKQTIQYSAGRKDECGAEFLTNKNKIMMIGVSTSMDTGLNLQHCSRLIRCETVMSPGALEQGNARIGRPNLKSKETRPFTFYDWILAANSIDVTKVAYLMTKKVRIAAVEEATNPIFAGMDVPELFSLSLDNITENNSRESLAPYLGPNGMYRDFLEREKSDFENFRLSNAHLLDANGKLKMVELQRGKDLTGSTIMRRVPYVPGLNIYGENELGLVRLDQFTKVEVKDEEEEADGASDGAEDDDDMSAEPEGEADDIEGDDDEVLISSEDAAKTQARQAKHDFMEKVKDVTVHTDMGEGVIHNATINRGRVRIRLNSGEFIYRSILSTFVITKPQTSMGDVRGSIAKMTGSIPIDTPWEVKPTKKVVVPSPAVVTKQVTKQHIDDVKELALNLVVTNDMIGLEYTNFSDKATTKTLRALKFADSPAHYFASIRNYVVMNRFFKTLLEKGYDMPKPQLMLVSSFYYSWKAKGGKAATLFGMGTATQQKNFYVLGHKPVPGKKTCVPYVSCESNRVYLCLPSTGHPGNINIAKTITNVPGVKFRPALPSIMRFFNSPSEAAAFVRTLLKTGYTLTNHNELHAEFTALRKEVPRATNKTMETFYDQKETK